jgi:hypothetical protein
MGVSSFDTLRMTNTKAQDDNGGVILRQAQDDKYEASG